MSMSVRMLILDENGGTVNNSRIFPMPDAPVGLNSLEACTSQFSF